MTHFEEYKKQGEPERYKRAENWGVAIGLQKVDDLAPSKHLIDVAKDNIEGKITVDEAAERVARYYQENPARTVKERNEKEADEFSARIAKLLSTYTFSFRPAELVSIHKALFSGILSDDVAGRIRTYDIVKKEPVLNGDTVVYGRADNIMEMLEYDFSREKDFKYQGLSKLAKAERLANSPVR